MRLSNQISVFSLIPGKRYIVEVVWNDTNTLRSDREYLLTGEFKRLEYIRGRTYSYDSGLDVLLAPSRVNAVFDINGRNCKVSSANNFYEIFQPSGNTIACAYVLNKLNLPLEVKTIIKKLL